MAKKWVKFEQDLRAELHADVDRYTSDAAAARVYGVTRGHLSRVLRGDKPITAKIARGLGYDRRICFVTTKRG